jgi:hypothetical protein
MRKSGFRPDGQAIGAVRSTAMAMVLICGLLAFTASCSSESAAQRDSTSSQSSPVGSAAPSVADSARGTHSADAGTTPAGSAVQNLGTPTPTPVAASPTGGDATSASALTPAVDGSTPTALDGSTAGSTADQPESTAAWFDTFCGTVTTAQGTGGEVAAINVGDAAAQQAALLGVITTLGTVLATASTTLSSLGSAGFDGDQALTIEVITELDASTANIAEISSTLTAAEPEDTDAQNTAVLALIDQTQQVAQLGELLSGPAVGDQTRSIVGALPSCEPLLP